MFIQPQGTCEHSTNEGDFHRMVSELARTSRPSSQHSTLQLSKQMPKGATAVHHGPMTQSQQLQDLQTAFRELVPSPVHPALATSQTQWPESRRQPTVHSTWILGNTATLPRHVPLSRAGQCPVMSPNHSLSDHLPP